MSDHLEERLGRVLHDRAEGVLGAPLTVHDVRRTARTIRRRRRAGAAGVALAALAVLVPVGLEVTGGAERTVQPAPPPAPTPGPDGTYPLGLGGIPAGESPAVPYLRYDDGTLVTPDGEVPLEGTYHQVVPYADGYLAVVQGASPGPVDVRLQRLDARHRPVDDLGPVTDAIVAAPDGSALTWVEVTDQGLALVVAEDGTEPTRTPLDAAYAVPVGFVDGGVVVALDDPPQAHVVVGDGGTVTALDGFQYAWDSFPTTDLVVGQTDYRGATDTQCSGARDAATGNLLWERCGLVLGDLSPDGTRVLAFGTPLLPGASSIAVLDARTGEPLVEHAAGGRAATVADATWEDTDSVLAMVEEDGRQALVRLGRDGSAELATDPVPGSAMERELRFVQRPLGGAV